MLLALKEIEKVKKFLETKIKNREIEDFRIYLNLDTTISINIAGKEIETLEDEINTITFIKTYIDEWIDTNEYQNDEYYQNLFKTKIDLGHRRRLINLIDKDSKKESNEIPVISFYSYKGGVGRTTSLITFANYYAYHHKKKVVILDFDFEAPGFTNYFDFSLNELENKNGVVEYILDKQASKEKLNLMQEYMVEVSKEYVGDGSIFVMPSGNLFGKNSLNSYIEALSRIDINSTDSIVKQIRSLILDINEIIEPDVILIDSRTGFNDIFGFLINKISDVIVGLFEDNIQTQPGIKLFLKEVYSENQINSIIVNSQVHKDSSYSKRLKEFEKKIQEWIIEIKDENYSPHIFDLRKNTILGNLGTIDDDRDDYFEFIKESTPNDYKKFFEKIIEIIDIDNIQIDDEKNNEDSSIKQVESKSNNIFNLKKTLLEKIENNYPENYAENYTNNMEYNEDFLNNKFYFRKCMEDIFNFDKFLLVGVKGTGKTAFYLAIKDENFLKNLQKKANKNQIKFSVVDIISLKESSNRTKYFEANKLINNTINNDVFYTDFWKVYILNSILIEKDNLNNYKVSNEISNFLPQKLNDEKENKNFFEK